MAFVAVMTKIQIFTGTPNRRVKNLQERLKNKFQQIKIFFCEEGPRSRCYDRTAALRLIVQPCDEEKDDQSFFHFSK
jgi:hypothetical protein